MGLGGKGGGIKQKQQQQQKTPYLVDTDNSMVITRGKGVGGGRRGQKGISGDRRGINGDRRRLDFDW